MKKFAFIVVLTIIMIESIFSLNPTFAQVSKINSYLDMTYPPPVGSKEELYQDIIVTLLEPHISKAVTDYYGTPYSFDLWTTNILEVERPNGNRTALFMIKLQIMTYIGAHNTVGIDNLTFRVSGGNKVILEKFEHIRSFPIPPWLKPHER